ncbi:MAG: hypothetical protein AAB257_05165 [Nitrospinota bacterium]
MRSNKKIVFISKNEELYKSFKRALSAVGSMTVLLFTNDSLKKKNRVVLISTPEDRIHELFYETIRSKHLNPIVVIGFKEKESFEKEFPIFHDHPYNHAYIRIPFNLKEFIDLLKNMIPISSQAIRKAICGSDSGYKGYLLKLLSHDLLKDKERCIEILHTTGNYLKDKKLTKEIEDTTKDIEKEKDWSSIAHGIGKRLENKIKGEDSNG